MDPLEINKVEIRNLQREDYDQLAASFTRVYADGSDVFWAPEPKWLMQANLTSL